MKNKIDVSYSYDRVDFYDELKEVHITGHFDSYLCGGLTTLERTIDTFKEELSVKIIIVSKVKFDDNAFDRHLKSVWAFKYKKDYNKVKKLIKELFKEYKDSNESFITEDMRITNLKFKK